MKELNSTNFKEVGETEKELFIIQFYSDTCGPCKAMTPVMQKLEENNNTNGSSLNIYKVNTGVDFEIAGQFDVRSVPTIVFCDGPDEIYRFVGSTPLVDLQHVIDNRFDDYFMEHGEFRVEKSNTDYKWLVISILVIVIIYVLFYFLS